MSGTETEGARPGPTRREAAGLLLALLALSLLFRGALDSPVRWHNPDEGLWAGVAAWQAETGAPLGEALLPAANRPLHFALYLVADRLFGHYPVRALAALHSLVVGATGWLLALAAARLLGLRRPGVLFLVGATFVLHSFTLYEGQGGNSEHVANLFLAAFLAVWSGGDVPRGGRTRRALAFALLGCAVQTKLHLAPLALVAPALWWLSRAARAPEERGPRAFAVEMALAAAWFLAPLVLLQGGLALAQRGQGDATGQLAGYVLGADARPWGWRLAYAYTRLHQHLAPVPLTCLATVAAVAALVAPLLRRGQPPSPGLRPLRLAAAVLLISLLGTLPGWRLFSHYFLLVLPAAVLVAAAVVERALASGVLRARTAALIGVTALLLAGPPLYLSLGRRDFTSDRVAGLWLAQNVGPEERVLVWGWAPQIYLFARRVPATRWVSCSYVVNDFDVPGLPPHDPVRLARLLADLEAHPPAVVVQPLDMHYAFDGDRYDLARVPALAGWLAERYEPPVRLDRNLVWIRRGYVPGGGGGG